MNSVVVELTQDEKSLVLLALLELSQNESMKMLQSMKTSGYDNKKYEECKSITEACSKLTKKINNIGVINL